MKLLIITQVVDKEHPVLGFFHRWIEEFAKHVETLHVICLEEGVHTLPAHVHVHSLGKEAGKSRLHYIFTFYRLIISLRHDYDRVFVHMNQVYVLLGAPAWKLFHKKVALWYAHGAVPFSLRIATVLSDTLFTSTPKGFRISTKKLYVVGQGIDTDRFIPNSNEERRETISLVTVGRITQSKNLDTLLRACALLKEKNIPFRFKIVGAPITEHEVAYLTRMMSLSEQLGLRNYVEWVGAVSNEKIAPYLTNADMFIHDGSTGSLDKALVEAALCGCIVISSNSAYESEISTLTSVSFIYPSRSPQDLFKMITDLRENYNDSCIEMRKIANFFKVNYSVENLISKIVKNI